MLAAEVAAWAEDDDDDDDVLVAALDETECETDPTWDDLRCLWW